MDEIYLDKCRCGGEGEFLTESNNTRIFAQCKVCGIRTPSKAASLEHSAKKLVADVWNAGTLLWPRWVQPAVAEDAYHLNDRVSYEGEHWISIRDKNVWKPGESGWRLVGPAPVEQGGAS